MVQGNELSEKVKGEGFVRVDEGRVLSHVTRVTRETLEQALNTYLDAEADAMCGAKTLRVQPGLARYAERELYISVR